MKFLKNPYVIVGALVAIAIGFYLYFKYILSLVMKSRENPNVKAFLMMIRKCEGTAGVNGYRTMFGGKTFSDTTKHPNVCVPFRDTCSTAAGAYQFLYRTWYPISLELQLKDFGEESQDLAAIYLIHSKNALIDVEQGRVKEAIFKIRKLWASLPGAGYNQPEKTLTACIGFYTAAGGKLA